MDEATQPGASVQERLEALLSAEEAPTTQEPPQGEEIREEESESATDEGSEATEGEHEDAEAESETLDVSDLAKYLGIEADKLDVSEDGSLTVKTKIDGEEGRANLADLLKSYQLEGHLTKKNMDVAEQQKALQAKIEAADQQAKERIDALDSLLKVSHDRLLSEYNAVDWHALRRDEPAEFSARLMEFQARQAEINEAMQTVAAERHAADAKRSDAMRQHLTQQAQKLVELIPEWTNAEAATKGKKEVADYVRSYGYSDEAISQIADAAQIAIIRKAMLYDQLQKAKPGVQKRVKAAPKLARPGAPKTQQEKAQADLNGLRKTVKKSGGKQGVVEYLLATGKA